MKNKDVLNLYEALLGLNLKGAKFSYAIARNIAILKPEVESLYKSQEMTKDFKEYDEKRIELAKMHSKKDEIGNPMVENNAYILNDKDAFAKAFEDLKKSYEVPIIAREQQIKEFTELMDAESNSALYTLYTFPVDIIPEEITTQQMTGIYNLIQTANE